MAFQPKFVSINGRPQAQRVATMTIGGAAKWVNVPPTEIFTNKRAKVA
jgi:hypothetical protein